MSLRDRIAALDSELLNLQEVEIVPSRSSTPARQNLDRKSPLGSSTPIRHSPADSTTALSKDLQNLIIASPSPRTATPVHQSLDSLAVLSSELQNLKEIEIAPPSLSPQASTPARTETLSPRIGTPTHQSLEGLAAFSSELQNLKQVEITPPSLSPRAGTPVRQGLAQPSVDRNYRKEALESSALARQDRDWNYRKELLEDKPARHSLDHRFDTTDPEVEAPPAPTPAVEKSNPFDSTGKTPFYDSIAASFGLGILDDDDFEEFNIYNAFVTNLRICPVHLTDTGRYYYVEHRFWTPKIPGVVLHRGNDKEGEVLAVAHIPIQGENTFGIGDFKNHPTEVVWEKMGNAGFWTHQRYEFMHSIESGEQKTFNWIRTRNNVMDDQGDLVLVEKDSDDVLAEYVGKGLLKWKKRGRLRIKNKEAEFGKTWELVVLTSWASVVELARRRARIRRYSPTHLISPF